MSDYLNNKFDLTDPGLVSVFDETPLWSARFGAMLLEHLPLRSGMRVMDLACGTGFPLIEFGQSLGETCLSVGLDTWMLALKRARLKMSTLQIEYLNLVCGDGTRMPFGEDSFDLVLSNLGVNNFDEPIEVMRECARVLMQGGLLVLTTNPSGHMREFYEVFEDVLSELGMKPAIERLHAQANHRLRLDEIRELLHVAGFELQTTHAAEFHLRYLDGITFLRHRFTQQAFLEGWKSVIEKEQERDIFNRLEHRLNERASREGELSFTVPVLYIEAKNGVG